MPYLLPSETCGNPNPAMYRPFSRDEAISTDYAKLMEERLSNLNKSEYFQKHKRFMELREQLIPITYLKPNWDSYGAEPPNEKARTKAAQILSNLEVAALLPTRLVPSAEGGVGFCFVEADRYADIECLNTGEILAAMYCGQQDPDVWEIDHSSESIQAAIEQIREHIAA